jgi:hypothetical protein
MPELRSAAYVPGRGQTNPAILWHDHRALMRFKPPMGPAATEETSNRLPRVLHGEVSPILCPSPAGMQCSCCVRPVLQHEPSTLAVIPLGAQPHLHMIIAHPMANTTYQRTKGVEERRAGRVRWLMSVSSLAAALDTAILQHKAVLFYTLTSSATGLRFSPRALSPQRATRWTSVRSERVSCHWGRFGPGSCA